MNITITFKCSLCCGEAHTIEIEVPEGWSTIYKDYSEEWWFCPKHSIVAEWVEKQCSTCAQSWKSSGLWDSFENDNYTLTDADMKVIRNGICPKRNISPKHDIGVFLTRNRVVEDLGEPKKTTTACGVVLAQAIEDYRQKYSDEA